MNSYVCSLCDHFSATSTGGILRHIGAIHAYEPNFHLVCGIDGCPRTYKNYHSFRKHLQRTHPTSFVDADSERELETNESIFPMNVSEMEVPGGECSPVTNDHGGDDPGIVEQNK